MVKTKVRAQVSSLGRFRSTFGVVSTPLPSRSGYVSVRVNHKTLLIHRLIAIAFDLPREIGQSTVDHADGNPSNNALSNLRWASREEQVMNSYKTNTKRKSHASKTSKPVRGRRLGTAEWNEYPSFSEAARALGLNQGNISACCARKQSQTGGFEFEFSTPSEPDVLNGEEWRNVEGTHAEVSSLGRFRSTRGVVTTPSPQSSGYVEVAIDGKGHKIHRLIAIAFDLPREIGQLTVDHSDGNPSNNKISNLRWASQKEQVRHSYKTNADRKSSASKRSKPVRARRQGTLEWNNYPSASEAARALGLKSVRVSACCTHKQTHAGGFEFEFSTPSEPDVLEGEEWRDVVMP